VIGIDTNSLIDKHCLNGSRSLLSSPSVVTANMIAQLKLLFNEIFTNQILNSTLLKKKFASIYCQFIIKVWPLDYLELDSILQSKWNEMTDLILYILLQLWQDVYIFNVKCSNKHAFTAGLMAITLDSRIDAELDQVTRLDLFKKMVQKYPDNPGWLLRISQKIIDLISSNSLGELLLLCLESIKVLFEWCPLNYLEKANVVQLCINLTTLDNLNVQIKAFDALCSLYSRHFGVDDLDQRKSLFWDPFFIGFPNFIALWNTYKNSTGKEYELIINVASLVNAFFCDQVCFKRNTNQEPQSFQL
jgi:hypothetical protein